MSLIQRRSFLGTLAAVAAGAILDPERALWVAGKRTFFLPPAPSVLQVGDRITIEGVGGEFTITSSVQRPPVQSILTATMITREALRVLEDNLAFAKHIHKRYDGRILPVPLPRSFRFSVTESDDDADPRT